MDNNVMDNNAMGNNLIDNNAYPNLKDLLILFLVVLLFMFGTGVVAAICQLIPNVRITPLIQSFQNMVAYIVGMLATIWYAARKSRKRQAESDTLGLGFNKFPGWLIPVLIPGALAMVVGMDRLSTLIPMPDSVAQFFESLFKNDVFSVMIIAVAAPILEEIFCRGIVLKGLLQNYPARKAIIYSALFFALIHLNPWQSIPAFFAGLFLGWIYYKTRSVIPGIIVHAVVNTTAVLSMFLPKEQQDVLGLLGTPAYIVVFIAAMVVFSAVCWYIQKKMPSGNP
ncbi:CPBP family intramembrane glutamic endopeptidase [Chitinophaga sancti]|uniref:CPBP family intramembrane glutamic endopeptidase n=1 Tax=Chitinophaga sancti TaxID=1004 RepID=A0A1K1R9R7_9BACT|nr:CPBP family intramembrane glutamic endopeptidase [Chitinophaga sancti]WQD65512.1 CPBP family intramembrane glutamic endopeptidase [Chitinophaga sancti]WQG88865.1 CPBP family intramembrane glutamic endopeptidase [Chitinophaga sancti]SFW68824.1 hypothetical protein SAMN05661012_03515 [Chitinophaga sancti]